MVEVTSDITRNCMQLRAVVSHGYFEVTSGFRCIIVYYRGSAVNVCGPRVMCAVRRQSSVTDKCSEDTFLLTWLSRHKTLSTIYGVYIAHDNLLNRKVHLNRTYSLPVHSTHIASAF